MRKNRKGKFVEASSSMVSNKSIFKEIIKCFNLLGKDLQVTFRKSVPLPNGYVELDDATSVARKQLLRVYYPHFKERNNIHIGSHLSEEAWLTATNRNTEVSTKEKKHKKAKEVAQHSNKRDLTRDFILNENNLMVLRYLLDGGVKDGIQAGPRLLEMRKDKKHDFLFHGLSSNLQNDWTLTKVNFEYFARLGLSLTFTQFSEKLVHCYRDQIQVVWEVSVPRRLQTIEKLNFRSNDFSKGSFVKIQGIVHKILLLFIHIGLDQNSRIFGLLQCFNAGTKDPELGWDLISPTGQVSIFLLKPENCSRISAEHNCKTCTFIGAKINHSGNLDQFIVNPHFE